MGIAEVDIFEVVDCNEPQGTDFSHRVGGPALSQVVRFEPYCDPEGDKDFLSEANLVGRSFIIPRFLKIKDTPVLGALIVAHQLLPALSPAVPIPEEFRDLNLEEVLQRTKEQLKISINMFHAPDDYTDFFHSSGFNPASFNVPQAVREQQRRTPKRIYARGVDEYGLSVKI